MKIKSLITKIINLFWNFLLKIKKKINFKNFCNWWYWKIVESDKFRYKILNCWLEDISERHTIEGTTQIRARFPDEEIINKKVLGFLFKRRKKIFCTAYLKNFILTSSNPDIKKIEQRYCWDTFSQEYENKNPNDKIKYLNEVIDSLTNFSSQDVVNGAMGNVFLKQLDLKLIALKNKMECNYEWDDFLTDSLVKEIMNIPKLEKHRKLYLQNFEISKTRKYIFWGFFLSTIIAPLIPWGLSKIFH